MVNNNQKKILIRVMIAVSIIAIYIFGGKQIVKPDPKGLGFFFLIFTGFVFSLIIGIILTTIILIKKKTWVRSLLFILTAIGNTLILIICFTMNNNNVLLYLLCYSGVVIGIIQLYLLVKYYLSIDNEAIITR